MEMLSASGIRVLRRAFITGIVLIAIGALALSGITLVLDIQQLVINNHWAMDTQSDIQDLHEVLSTLKDAESAQRGFLLTGNTVYLDQYQSAVDLLPSQMADLRVQFASDPDILRQLVRIQTLIDGKLAVLDTAIRAREIGGLPAAQAIVNTNVGKNLMDALRAQITNIGDTQNILLTQRQAQVEINGRQTILLAGFMGILAVVIIGFAFSAVIRQTRRSWLAKDAANNEKHFAEQITDTVPIAVFIYDIEQLHFTFANQRFRELFGVTTDTVTSLGEDFYKGLFDPADASVSQIFGLLGEKVPQLQDDETLVEELKVRDAHDNWHWVELRLKVRDRLPNGKIKTILAAVSDLTPQKTIEQELRQNTAFVERVTNSVPSLVIVYDAATYQYVFINQQARAALELFDRGGMQAPYKNLRLPLHPDDLPKHDDCWQQLLQEPLRTIETELRLWGSHDVWRWMSVRYLVLTTTPQGRPKQILLTAWDITQQKEATQQAGQLALETERSSLLKNFIEISSHDLNTPLAVAMTAGYMVQAYTKRYLERHAQGSSDPAADDGLQLANHLKAQHEKLNPALDRLKLIIANMLEMVQIDFDLRLNCQLIDLDLVVDQVVLQMRARTFAQQITLTRVPSPGLPTGCFDIDYMRRAISNVLLNAILYTPENGTVTVRTFERGEDIVIEIADTGVGIPETHLPHIFDRFYRVDTARRGTTGGNGLGLAITKRIVEGHGGHIDVESTLGQGSTFRIVLPLRSGLVPASTSSIPRLNIT